MPSQQYIFRVTSVVKVTDGDTYHLVVDVGFHCSIAIQVRLDGYDCPERTKGSEFEKSEAKRAQALAAIFLARTDGTLWVRTLRDPDNFGRWLGDVWIEDDAGGKRHLGAELRAAGLASIWPARWRTEYDKPPAVEGVAAPEGGWL